MEGERMFFYPESKEEKKNPLLEGPELISPEEEKKNKNFVSFSFSCEAKKYYFGHKDGKPFFIIEYFNSLPDELSETEKAKFKKEIRKQNETEKIVYVFRYGEIPELKNEEVKEPDLDQDQKYRIAQPRDFERDAINRFIADDSNKKVMSEILERNLKLTPEENSQLVEQFFEAYRKQDEEAIRTLKSLLSGAVAEKIRNEIKEKMLPKPQEIKTDQLGEILKNKKVLFYTGAGISVASGVHSMDQLQKALGIDMSEKIDDLLKKAINSPEKVIDSWEEFTKSAFENPPTPAHQSLGRLAQKLKSQIFTENIDHLQEKTGVKAIHLTGKWLKENIQPEWLKDIDLIITVGLSYDDKGFLNWYKENNPNGKIIAINFKQPSYLGNEDFIIKGDCQKIIPELEKEFIERQQN